MGEEALACLDAALAELRSWEREANDAPSTGIVLGRMLAAFGEAHLAAAAVLAALDVQRRRMSA